jgi:hypothetical protein
MFPRVSWTWCRCRSPCRSRPKSSHPPSCMQVVIILSYPLQFLCSSPRKFSSISRKKKNSRICSYRPVTDDFYHAYGCSSSAAYLPAWLAWVPDANHLHLFKFFTVQQVTRCVYLRPSIIICLYAWSDTFILYSIVPLKNDYIEMQVHFWKSSFGSFSWKVKRLILPIIKRRDESGESAWCYFRM